MTITDFQWVHLGKAGAYLIENDGTDSTFWYSSAFPDAGATWTSTALTGVYSKIRVGSVPGVVYILFAEDSGGATLDILATATGNGQDTGLDFTSGETITITASGTWNAAPGSPIGPAGNGVPDPLYPLPSSGLGTLVGRVGTTGAWFEVSTSVSLSSPATGRLYLEMNDSAHGDNSDFVTAVINGGYGGVSTRYSTNYGSTFATGEVAGLSIDVFNGFDTSKVGTIVLVGCGNQVYKASAGGAYAAYGTTLPSGFAPSCIWIPRYQFTSSTTLNNATNPEYLIASNVEDGAGETMYRVTASGNTFFAVSPDFGGKGLAVSQDCLAMPYKSSKRISAVLDFSGSTKLVTSISTGSAWLNRDTVLGALSVRYRRGDSSLMQLYVSSQGGLVISQNHGALLQTRLSPGPTALLGAEPMG